MLQRTMAVVLAVAILIPGCSEEPASSRDTGITQDRGLILPDTGLADTGGPPGDTVEPACGPGVYPCGPYGKVAGAIIENHTFSGYADPNEHCKTNDQKQGDTSKLITIALKDWYKGDPACPAQKKKLLWILGSASWCGICNAEIVQVQAAYAKNQIDPRVGFLNVIIDGDTVGGAPTDDITKKWISSKGLAFPVATDANRTMASYFTASGFPLNILVDLSNMKIYHVKNQDSLQTIGNKIAQFFGGP